MKKKMEKLLGLFCFATPMFASAYELERAMENMADDVADCAVYYTIVSADLSQRMKEKPDERTEVVFNGYQHGVSSAISLMRVYMMMRPEKYFESKLDLHMQFNLKKLKEEGMDRLIVLYSDFCKDTIEHPNDRFDYWLKK